MTMEEIDVTRKGIGVSLGADGVVDVNVWAPKAGSISIGLESSDRQLPLTKQERGYWTLTTSDIAEGERYYLKVDNEKKLPDPCSLAQPEGVFGNSQVVDLRFPWIDGAWKNPDLEQYIIYELHVGTFSSTHDFEGIKARLGYLKELGVTAIELMPIAQFSGRRNWGYDGVFPFAVQNTYGGAKGLQALVDACHAQGLAVILDVVYNHLGPEGNVFNEFGYYFTDKYKTPWGAAVNFDDAWCDAVRRFFVENALMWFRDFHIDALRLDAVHAIKDFSPRHILKEIRDHVDKLMLATGRRHYLVVECDLNDTRFINRQNGYGMDAQWTDEFHHALRVAAGQKKEGYYEDFNGVIHLATAFTDAYVYNGIYSPHRLKNFGTDTRGYDGRQFVVFSQNHDQVGNRAMGERTSTLVSFEMQKLLATTVMFAPYLPMLFMGEEWAEPSPFLYFVSFSSKKLNKAVAEGRKQEFAAFSKDITPPDPTREDTFNRSCLQWQLLEHDGHNAMLQYYKALISFRKTDDILNCLSTRSNITAAPDEARNLLTVTRWNDKRTLAAVFNFSNALVQSSLPFDHTWEKLWDSADPIWKGPGAGMNIVKGGDEFFVQPESVLIYTTTNHV